MVIRGRAQLADRVVRRSPELPDADRRRVLASLAVIDAAVLNLVDVIDDWGARLLAEGADGECPRRWQDIS